MQDRHIGDVRVTRIEEQMGPGFPAKDFFPEFDAPVLRVARPRWRLYQEVLVTPRNN